MDKSTTGEKLIVVLAFTLTLSVMNATMFNVALPSISNEFKLLPSQVSWVVSSYIIVYAIGVVTYGKLADKYRLKDLLTFGISFFALGSIIGLVSGHYWMVILGRVLQSMGAAVIPAASMLIPVRYFTPETRGRALGISSSGLAFGAALGPIVGGFLTGLASWRLLFALSIFSLATLPFYRKYLDDEKGKVAKTDFGGGILFALSVAFLLLAITYSSWKLMISAAFLFIVFFIHIRYTREPFIQPALFKNKSYSNGIMIYFLACGISYSSIPFLTPQFLAMLYELSPSMIGLIMFPGAIVAAFLGRVAGRLADQKGNPFLVFAALGSQFISFAALSITAGTLPAVLILFFIFGNIGQLFMQIGMANTVSRSLSKEEMGIGMGLFLMVNFIAGSIGATLIGKVLDLGTVQSLFNPFLLYESAALFSNIYFILTLLVVSNATFYYLKFGKKREKNAEYARKERSV